jgi:hypothetical protein
VAVADSLDVVPGPGLVNKDAASQRFTRQHLSEQHRQVALSAAQIDDGDRVATRWLSVHIVAHCRNDRRSFYDLLDEPLGAEKAAPKGLIAAIATPPCHHALYQIGIDIPVSSGAGRLCQLCLQPCSEGCIRRSLQWQRTGEGCIRRSLQWRRTDGTSWQTQRQHKLQREHGRDQNVEQGHSSSHVICGKDRRHTGQSYKIFSYLILSELQTGGMRGSSPQGSVARVRKQRAHSVGSAAAAAVTRVLSSKHDFLDDVRRVREDSRGDDASEVFAGDARKRGHCQRTRTQSRYASPPRAAQRSQAGRRPHVPRARRRACSIVPACLGLPYPPPADPPRQALPSLLACCSIFV